MASLEAALAHPQAFGACLLTILYRSAKDEVAGKLRWFYVSTSATATTLQTAEMPAFVDRLKTTTFEIVPHF